jgi:hypothetical protein
MDDWEMSIFVFEPDLLFSSKFENLSRLIGQQFRVFTEVPMLLKVARSERPSAFIINLDAMEPEAVQDVVKLGVPVMGYYSHVNSERARVAIQSGVDQVVTRGAFVANSTSLVRELLDTKRQGL